MTDDRSREMFEAWCTSTDSPVPAGTEWASIHVDRYLRCWQASRAVSEQRIAELEKALRGLLAWNHERLNKSLFEPTNEELALLDAARAVLGDQQGSGGVKL